MLNILCAKLCKLKICWSSTLNLGRSNFNPSHVCFECRWVMTCHYSQLFQNVKENKSRFRSSLQYFDPRFWLSMKQAQCRFSQGGYKGEGPGGGAPRHVPPFFLQRLQKQGVWLCVGTQAPPLFFKCVCAPPPFKIPGSTPGFSSLWDSP